jgi:predicted molibdopterin-dependent oxidoreductase YjgC
MSCCQARSGAKMKVRRRTWKGASSRSIKPPIHQVKRDLTGRSPPSWRDGWDVAHRSNTTPREIFDEIRQATKGAVADYYGVTSEKIDEQQGVFWPCPTLDHPGSPRLYAERFAHRDGKAKMFPSPIVRQWRSREATFPSA